MTKRAKQKVLVTDLRAATVDELAGLNEALLPHEAAFKRRDALKKLVRTWPDEDGAAGQDTKMYLGTGGNAVILGPSENERKYKKGAITEIYKALGLTKFLAGVSMTLKAAEALLGDRLAEFIYEERTGSRPITIAKHP